MKRKKRRRKNLSSASGPASEKASKKSTAGHNPFSGLQAELQKQVAPAPKPPAPRLRKKRKSEMSDEELFARAMRDVTPLKGNKSRILAEKHPLIEVPDEEAEAYRALEALVQGKVQFHLEGEGDECVEGRVKGVTRGVMRKLRRGQFAIQDYLDLHGMVRTDARAALERFIENCAQQGKKSVLIVHGRGLNSERKIPVLKRGVVKWLTRGKLARWTLAFCSARPVDGGAGATYVLLRNRAPQRNSRKPPRLTLDAEWYFDA